MEINGKIETILKIESGQSKQGKEWKKLGFTILTDDKYNNVKYFEIWSALKIDSFLNDFKIKDHIKVYFNIKCNAYKDRYFTNLEAWKFELFTNDLPDLPTPEDYEHQDDVDGSDDLPF
tara:strand:- start:4720 stop:5076 length:357 start_codon:yes stop_codon:yes gene_type:complete